MSRNLPFTTLDPSFLQPRDPVLGYIKIGGKEKEPRMTAAGKPWACPIRFIDPPRFEVVTREKIIKHVQGTKKNSGTSFPVDLGYKRDAEFHRLIKEENPTTLNIRLMYPMPGENFLVFLGAHSGKRWECRGNGVAAMDEKRGDCPCPCPRLEQFEGNYKGRPPNDGNKLYPCKPHGQLMVILEDANIFGGFWPFKTTGYTSISNIMATLALMQKMFDRVDGLPLEFRVMQATIMHGGIRTTQPVVTLVLAAAMNTARQIAADAAEESRKYLPLGTDKEKESYRDAAIQEMEEAGDDYLSEFVPEVVDQDEPVQKIEAEEEDAAPDPEGPNHEVAEDDDSEEEPPEPNPIPNSEEEAPPEEVPEEPPEKDDSKLESTLRAVMKEANWDPAAINARVEHHRRNEGHLNNLNERLKRNSPDAWLKIRDGMEPSDGLAE